MAAGMNQTKAWALSIFVSSTIAGGIVGLMLFNAKKSLSAKHDPGSVVVTESVVKVEDIEETSIETPADEVSKNVEENTTPLDK